MRTRTRTTSRWLSIPVLVAAVLLLLTPTGASAHERRPLPGGRYQAVVGLLTEPAYDGLMNGVDLTVTDESQKGADGKGIPVLDLEKTLNIEVSVPSGAKQQLTLRSRSGMPGKYAANFMPTATGQYVFRVYGTISDLRVDERFDKSEIASLSEVQFPNKATGAADLQAQLTAAKGEVNTARAFGIAGVVLGALGLVTGGVGLARRPSRARIA